MVGRPNATDHQESDGESVADASGEEQSRRSTEHCHSRIQSRRQPTDVCNDRSSATAGLKQATAAALKQEKMRWHGPASTETKARMRHEGKQRRQAARAHPCERVFAFVVVFCVLAVFTVEVRYLFVKHVIAPLQGQPDDVSQYTALRILPGENTSEMGDLWTVREFQAYAAADCSGEAVVYVGTRASAHGLQAPLAFDGREDTFWQGSCRSCTAMEDWVAFRTSGEIKCVKVLQCMQSGCAPSLQLQIMLPGTSSWADAARGPVAAGFPGHWITIRVQLPGFERPAAVQTCSVKSGVLHENAKHSAISEPTCA